MRGRKRRCGEERGRRSSGLLGSRGESTLGCAVMLALMVAGGFVAYKFIIPYYHYNAFEGGLSEMMPYYRNQSAEFIQGAVIDTARDFDLDLKPEQVKVQVLRRDNRIIVDVEYEQTVELPFYTHTLVFKPHLTGSVY